MSHCRGVKFSDWRAVVIYPSRSLEQKDIYPHRSLLNGNQVHRIYLDELGDIRKLPVWVTLMVLTTLEEDRAPEQARYLLSRTTVKPSVPSNRVIMEMITTIMVYKFEQLSRAEVESMLGITLKETRVYREIREQRTEEGTFNLIIRAWSNTHKKQIESKNFISVRGDCKKTDVVENL